MFPLHSRQHLHKPTKPTRPQNDHLKEICDVASTPDNTPESALTSVADLLEVPVTPPSQLPGQGFDRQERTLHVQHGSLTEEKEEGGREEGGKGRGNKTPNPVTYFLALLSE